MFIFILFVLILLSATRIMNDTDAALSTTTDVRASTNAAGTNTRTNTRAHRARQPPFSGQNPDWSIVITADKLRANTYNKVYRSTVNMVPSICKGNLQHILTAISLNQDTKFVEPPLDGTDEKSQLVFKIKYAEHSKIETIYNNNKIILAASLRGQCDESVLHQLADMNGHAAGQYDILWVLSAINQLCNGVRNDQSPLLQVVTALRRLYVTKQQDQHSLHQFREEFEQNVLALKAIGATITLPESCLELEDQLDPNNKPSEKQKQERALERVMALSFITQCDQSADATRTLLKTQYVQKQDRYPKDIAEAFNLLRTNRPQPTSSRPNRSSRALTMAQRTNNNAQRDSTSSNANSNDANSGNSNRARGTGSANGRGTNSTTSDAPPQNAVSFDRITSLTQNNSIVLSDSLILLDSCSMCSIFKSPHLIRNLGHYSTKGLPSGIMIVSNGGSMECSQVGKLPGLSFPVWYHPDSIANIVSLAEMVRERRVTMDSDMENALLLHAHDGRLLRFEACGGGVYAHDLNNKDHVVTPNLALTQTVAQLESQFTKREVSLMMSLLLSTNWLANKSSLV